MGQGIWIQGVCAKGPSLGMLTDPPVLGLTLSVNRALPSGGWIEPQRSCPAYLVSMRTVQSQQEPIVLEISTFRLVLSLLLVRVMLPMCWELHVCHGGFILARGPMWVSQHRELSSVFPPSAAHGVLGTCAAPMVSMCCHRL